MNMQIEKGTWNSHYSTNPITRKLIANLIQACEDGCFIKANGSRWLEMSGITNC